MSKNRLAGETSPYLQQHADNPVDWYPWGDEALRASREQDKPILLSVGYSACHWCHVMAHESFEDPQVAAVMNRLYINIKVDREERPDLDQIYQTAHSLLTQRSGGWPLTMFLTPDQKPFFGGTYFPKEPRYGLPGFTQLLEHVARAFREQRPQIEVQNASLLEVLQQTQVPGGAGVGELGMSPIHSAVAEMVSVFDAQYGGFGAAPKFPHPAELEFCLYFARHDPRLKAHALFSLERMANGGIYDQLGGGFSRYSVDQYWMIPHFEKMLYDNGPLLALYADAWRLEHRPLFKRVVEETAAWAMREMQSQEGGYFSSLDADSEGEEGRFYVWSRDQVRSALDADEYEVASAHFGLDRPPNFEHANWHLHIFKSLETVAADRKERVEQTRQILDRARAKLFAEREQRVRPGRDEKILVSWNALMMGGMARAARAFGRADWLDSARRAGNFVAETMFKDGRLQATYKDGRAQLNAYLDDYAFLIMALLEMLQADFRIAELTFARALCDTLLEQFEDTDRGGFFFVSHEHEALIVKPTSGHDNATPSGNAVAAQALLRMGYLLGEMRYVNAAERLLRRFVPLIEQRPGGFASMCMALGEAVVPTRTVILRGFASDFGQWQQTLLDTADFGTMVFCLDKRLDGLPAVLDKPAPATGVNAYLCEGVSCHEPTNDIAQLGAWLGNG